jgi:hypothetical protein
LVVESALCAEHIEPQARHDTKHETGWRNVDQDIHETD